MSVSWFSMVFFLNKLFHNLESTGIIQLLSVNGSKYADGPSCSGWYGSRSQPPNSTGYGLDGPVGVYESMGGSMDKPAHNPTYARQNMLYGLWSSHHYSLRLQY